MCFGRADVETENRPPRYCGGPLLKRLSFLRDVDGASTGAYEQSYSRPTFNSAGMRQVEYRSTKSGKHEVRSRDTMSQFKSPSKINYSDASRFVPLPPVIRKDHNEESHKPKKSILRDGKKRYASQPSMVVYSPKRGRRERKYYYEDEDSDSDSDRDNWDGRSARTEWTEASGDSWAMRPVSKYADTRRRGRSRSREKRGKRI